ncbi:Uncharacterised protein [Anaerotruncus sp. 2789STDY5834896]|uniref:Uncharacterized protein n=1 Tax=uncultured Anaerotruncus sp. TaxID=905011 RepID=A0A1C6I6T4_9FIRM|nr:Uncharacterised protein [uncultured Anaerotruncus sp.]
MRILDEQGNELETYDNTKGYLVNDKVLIARHEAVEAVEEQGHFETIAEYPNGGKDVEWVVDTLGVEAAEAWDEYEDIYRYIPYTEAELAEIAAEVELQAKIRALPDTAVTWDDLAAALTQGVNSI